MRHAWHQVWGTSSEPVELYEPYRNRACLECHGGAQSYEEQEAHTPFRAQLLDGSVSCLTCHNLIHEILKPDRFGRWRLED